MLAAPFNATSSRACYCLHHRFQFICVFRSIRSRIGIEVRQRAIRMVLESQGEYDSQWASIWSIVPKIGCTPEALRVRVRQHERDTGGGDGGLTTAERQRLKELERENRELCRSNDIFRQASAYFAKAEFDRLWKK